MGNEWEIKPLGECLSFVIDHRGKTPKKLGSDWVKEGIPTLSAKNVRGGRLVAKKSIRYVTPEVYKRWMNSGDVKRGDCFLVSEGATLGECMYWDEDFPIVLGQRLFCLRANSNILYPRYFYFYMTSHDFQEEIIGRATGTSVLGLRQTDVLKLRIRLPSLKTQQFIGDTLYYLNKKIELNRRMNVTLEGMAQALFKSWFVDFDPVLDNALAAGNPIPDALAERAATRRQALANGTANRQAAKPFPATFHFTEDLGWIPEGWVAKKLSDLLEVKYGKDHKKLSDGNIPVYGSGGLMRHAEKSLYKGESVLIPRKGTLSNILYLNEEFWTVDTMFYTIPKNKFIPKYAFYHLKSLDFTSMNVGSAVPSMTTKVLNELPILMPAETALQDFDTILTAYFRKVEANNSQSKSLAKLRDTLLPKLISGELRISDAQKLAAEALA